MKHHDPTRLLHLQSAELTDRTPFCLEDQQVAEYFDGALPLPERAGLEHHIADCRYCSARIGMLGRLAESSGMNRVTEAALAKAKQLGQGQAARRRSRIPAWAAAAIVVLAVFIANRPGETPGPVPTSTGSQTASDGRQLRNIEPVSSRLEVFTPRPGQILAPGERVEWMEVSGKLHYDVYVLSDDGDVLQSQRLDFPAWELDASLGLVPGKRYYLRIEAPLSDGRSLRSRHIAFQVAER